MMGGFQNLKQYQAVNGSKNFYFSEAKGEQKIAYVNIIPSDQEPLLHFSVQ